MMPTDFGSRPDNARLTPAESAAVADLGRRVALTVGGILTNALGPAIELGDGAITEIGGDEIALVFGGPQILTDCELELPDGRVFHCTTLVSAEDIREMMGLDPTDDLAMHLMTLAECLEGVITALNADFASNLRVRGGGPHLTFAGIREVDLGGGDTLGEVSSSVGLVQASYQLHMGESPNIVDFTIYHLAPHEFFKALAPQAAAPNAAAVQDLDQNLIDQMLQSAGPRPSRPSAPPRSAPPQRAAPPRPAPERGQRPPPPRQAEQRRAPAFGNQGFGAMAEDDGYGDLADDAPTIRPAQFGPIMPQEELKAPSNLDLLLDVNLRVTVELGRTTRSIREILDLGPGSVLELDRLAGEPVDILVNDRPVARGEVVVVEDENFGVRVTDIISPAKRIQSLR